MMKILYTVLFSFVATVGIGYLLLPVLHEEEPYCA